MAYCVEVSYLEFFESERKETAFFYALGAFIVRSIQVVLDTISLIPISLKLLVYGVMRDKIPFSTNLKLASLIMLHVIISPFQLIGFALAMLLPKQLSYRLLAIVLRPIALIKCKIAYIKSEYDHSRWRKKCELIWVKVLRRLSKIIPEVILPFFLEPRDVLGAGILYPLQNEHQLHNLNPEKVKGHPIVCVHGDKHNQTAWFPLAHALNRELFTLNLKSGAVTDEDDQALLAKIEQFDEKVTLIGHSRGAEVIEAFVKKHPERVEQVITLGTPISDESIQGVDIIAILDEIVPLDRARKNCVRLREGHLSLLSSPMVHRVIQGQLNST